MRKIIIPAAGRATRFNGVLKEFADVQGESALERTVRMAVEKFNATEVVVVTSAEKLEIHMHFIRSVLMVKFPDTEFNLVVQTSRERDLLDAIIAGLSSYPSNVPSGVLLPDSVFDTSIPAFITSTFLLGVFTTRTPERFSILSDNGILTKPQNISDGVYQAWGVLLWSQYVSEEIMNNHDRFDTYDELFTYIMQVHGYNTFNLDYYYDIGSIERYMEFLEDML